MIILFVGLPMLINCWASVVDGGPTFNIESMFVFAVRHVYRKNDIAGLVTVYR